MLFRSISCSAFSLCISLCCDGRGKSTVAGTLAYISWAMSLVECQRKQQRPRVSSLFCCLVNDTPRLISALSSFVLPKRRTSVPPPALNLQRRLPSLILEIQLPFQVPSWESGIAVHILQLYRLLWLMGLVLVQVTQR